MNLSIKLFSLALVATVLSGCVPSGTIKLSEKGDVREEALSEMVAMKKARMLSENCRRMSLITLGYNEFRDTDMRIALTEKAKAQGYTRRDLSKWASKLDHATLQNDLMNYIKSRKLVFGEPLTFCEAGEKEIAMKSQIGSYLYIRDIHGKTREELGVTIPKPEGK
ncbi:hypothetical protein BMI91_02020 [Thioclava sediminum]|uniref:Lipoprotein n=1 Tax=Thioclava sediminum TaxID=1915319 RepID=A0ABX3N016_9RHOB|nr:MULTISPECIES: DUF5333 family protein [Thioclava]MPQ93635.1 hypothetical protein [Thioclava sp. JE_KL1]OOY06236.1 hypothetical protein BMI87_01655 [Thioclava sp. F28-4]OOY25223.1 hypothetical protein BMI91_02020 [Thioclava sediminum]